MGVSMQETHLSNSPVSGPADQQDAHTTSLMQLYEGMLAKNPDQMDALYFLGTLYARHGWPEKAIPLLRRALAHMPRNVEGFNTLGLALRQAGHMKEAVAAFRRALELAPHYRAALVNLGDTLSGCGDQAGAIAAYRMILTIDGHNADISRYREILVSNPTDIATINRLGKALQATGRYEEAASQFEQALTYAPDNVETTLDLGALLIDMERRDRAADCYRALLAHRPDSYTVHMQLGKLLHKNGRHNEALHHFKKARTLKPDEAAAHAAVAAVLQETGQIEAAIQGFRRAIALAPDRARYYLCLTRLAKLAADDPVLPVMQKLAADNATSLPDKERSDIHFALGKALSDIGEHQHSFAHIQQGNALRRRHINYDEKRVFAGMRKMRELFSTEAIAGLARTGHSSTQPIFIVGMPRSGSTLVEQILARHPAVYAAGEVGTLLDTFRDAATQFPAWKTVAPLAHLTEAERFAVAEDYLQRLNARVADWTGDEPPQRITNKTLGNYLYIGLIHQLWPNARIIHTMRDPVDTCLSCFSIPFNTQEFSFDLGELGRRYRQYHELMEHWRKVLPAGAMLDVRYEDVVENLEASARRIIAYCGLEWDEACLDFHKSTRPVRTSSMEQVRNPIYRNAIGRWRPDDETLRPLLEGLGSLKDGV